MIINIQDDILTLHNQGLLKKLLEDKTTKKNIMWATDAYSAFGERYFRNEEIRPELITGANSDIIKTRARKELEHQAERTKQRAEVFTPLWICKRMNDDAERYWFESVIDNKEDLEIQDCIDIVIKDKKLFKKYVDSKRLEITCGEAPYLISRYDVATGEMIPVEKRIGLLDRKIQAISRFAQTEDEWFSWVIRAYQSIFGYEFQGDNVLIARVNILLSLSEHMQERWGRKPTQKELEKISNIVSWNIWQMDGLTMTIPYSEAEERFIQLDLFGLLQDEESQEAKKEENIQPYCRIYDWRNKRKSIEFQELKKGMRMKFDFIIGNPPYQEETEGTSDKPVYNYFMDEAFEIAEKVELITPARFLFNAGKTPSAWNKKMLNNKHFKVLEYYEKSGDVFPNTKIRGGICISFNDANKSFDPITVFSPMPIMNAVIKKVLNQKEFDSLSSIMVLQNRLNLDALYLDYPEYKKIIGSKGKEKRLESGIFDKIPLFTEKEDSSSESIKIYGVVKKKRVYRYFPTKYLETEHANINNYKAVIMKSNGVGLFGEIIAAIDILEPKVGYTQSYIGIGSFNKRSHAENCRKYLKTKFARALLAVKKVTQDNPPDTWACVPLQDFTESSDINWGASIQDVDMQLYNKYGFNKEEINFIETHVKEME